MASDSSMQEKTEAPTPKRRRDARDEGRIPKSQELTTALLLLGAALVVNGLGPGLARTVSAVMHSGLIMMGAGVFDGAGATQMLQHLGWRVLAALSSVLLALMGMGLVIAGAQARGVLTLKPLTPKWERLSPLQGAKKMVGLQPIVELIKSLVKLLIVGIAIWMSLRAAWDASLALPQQSPMELLVLLRTYAVRLLMTAGLSFLALAGADYAYQWWQHEKGLRMTKQEVKDESKQTDGDPMVKARMRSLGRSLARRQMMKDVPTADVVVTNPTHIAVALKYDPETSDAPVVLAMGQRKVAERIKELARESGVPMVENKPLARALLAHAQVGIAIPPQLYLAVAEVLAWVFSQRKRRPGGEGARA